MKNKTFAEQREQLLFEENNKPVLQLKKELELSLCNEK